jgi:hypothetical protein
MQPDGGVAPHDAHVHPDACGKGTMCVRVLSLALLSVVMC